MIKNTMQKHFLKFRKVFTNFAFPPLILISNNSVLSSDFLPNDLDQSISTLEINQINDDLFERFDFKKEQNFLIAENENNIREEGALISEIIIKGWENHPEGRKL